MLRSGRSDCSGSKLPSCGMLSNGVVLCISRHRVLTTHHYRLGAPMNDTGRGKPSLEADLEIYFTGDAKHRRPHGKQP
eukprot:2568685-Amphidinium_carterae.1